MHMCAHTHTHNIFVANGVQTHLEKNNPHSRDTPPAVFERGKEGNWWEGLVHLMEAKSHWEHTLIRKGFESANEPAGKTWMPSCRGCGKGHRGDEAQRGVWVRVEGSPVFSGLGSNLCGHLLCHSSQEVTVRMNGEGLRALTWPGKIGRDKEA